MVGVPVIINHKDINKDNANDERVGVVSNVWFDDKDGWYWCDGVIWDETAQNLITDKGWSVSCSYDVKLADDAGGTENNVPYDIEFLDGVFTHLAIVDNPRYERANIVFNSKTVINNQFKEEEHPRDNDGKFTSGGNSTFYNEATKTIELQGNELGSTEDEIRENGLKYFKENYQGKKFDNPELKGVLFSRAGLNKLKSNSADIEKIKAIPALKDIIEKGKYQGSEDLAHPRQDGIIKFHRINHDVSINGQKENMSVLIGEDRDGNRFYNLNNRTYTAENSSRVIRAKGRADEEFSINIITDIQENFNPDIKNNVQNNKENTEMKLIEELKKLITKVENDKGEDMDKKQRIMNILNAANVDEDVKKEVENELDKEDEKPEEKVDNENEDDPKSEKDTADNKKVKNENEKSEEKVEELKKEVKEDVENKCKNSVENSKGGYFDKMNEIYNSAIKPQDENIYVSREQKLKDAEAYFAK